MIDAISRLMPPAAGAGAASTLQTGDLAAAAPQQVQPGITDAAESPSFADVFEQVSRDAVQSLKGAEATSIAALQDRASALEVVEAIKSAEQALQTATAIRDKIVQSYQEISRMAI
ncbi:MAG TPA: flagellar hook-basal body complex protein FliE [Paracoccaceae bacterium]|nr:flagellar hook-basal body complex protein FliE [Paracoccaceae bacterium]